MSEKQKDLRVAGNLVFDTIATLAAFVVFFLVCRSHVPSENPAMIALWGILTASCMSGVFWFALQMFKVVLRGQRDVHRSGK